MMRTRTAAGTPILVLVSMSMVIAAVPRLEAQSAASLQAARHAGLESALNEAAAQLNGVLGYAIKDLTTGEGFYRNADIVFPTASSIKLAVLLELMRQAQGGKLSLEEEHIVRRNETVAGDPILYMLG